jgi:septal ring factor EnvC (AmiA/AmiB activator)
MPTLKEISDRADSLQTALDAEQQQVADLLAEKEATNTALQANIVTLNETITLLQGQIGDGGTTEERQAVLDKLIALEADLQGTVAP